MKQVTFTSTLPSPMVKYLDECSKRDGIPKNKILEQAFLFYMEEKKRYAMSQSFKRAALDKEMQFMAEEGITDYLKLIKK